MDNEEHIRSEVEKYILLAKKHGIELNGKNFVDLIHILGGVYFVE